MILWIIQSHTLYPVLVNPDTTHNPNNLPYKAAAKLKLQEQAGGEYTISLLQTYGMNPADDSCVTVTFPLEGNNDYVLREPEVQRLREIEIDPNGQHIYVLSAQGLGSTPGANDWVLVFDTNTGEELRISTNGVFQPSVETCQPAIGPGTSIPKAPSCLTISSDGNALYMTSALANANPFDVSAEVKGFSIDRSGGTVTGLSLTRTVNIDANELTNQWFWFRANSYYHQFG